MIGIDGSPGEDHHFSSDLLAFLDAQPLHAVYQPIVNLTTGEVVGYEALARGAPGSPGQLPDVLFAEARRQGVLADVDRLARAAAVRGAREAGLIFPLRLFVNVEAEALGPEPDALRKAYQRASRDVPVVVEVTERALVADPAALFAAVASIRRAGWGIALDDVGVEMESLALMPFLRPDVIKLDRTVIQQPTPERTAVTVAVLAEAERTGALVLAEGIETEAQLQHARGLGAALGQGWAFARPGPLTPPLSLPALPIDLVNSRRPLPASTPFDYLAEQRPLHCATKRELLELSAQLERQALALPDPPVVLATFQHARNFTPRTARRYMRLARHSSLVAAIGAGLGGVPAPGVRGASFHLDHPLAREWTILVVSPFFAGGFSARDRGDNVPDLDRRFEYALTYDRDLVVSAANMLMQAIAPIA